MLSPPRTEPEPSRPGGASFQSVLEHATGAATQPQPPSRPQLELPTPSRNRAGPGAEQAPIVRGGVDMPRPSPHPATPARGDESRPGAREPASPLSSTSPREVGLPTVGQPLTPQEVDKPEARVVRIEEEPRIRPPSRGSPPLEYDDEEESYAPWEGVHPSRIVHTLADLLALRCPTGDEGPTCRYLHRRLRDLPVTWRTAAGGDAAGEDVASNIVVEVPGVGRPLLFVAHMDAENPPPLTHLVREGPLLHLEGAGAGLHGRAGVAVLLEAIEVLVGAVSRDETPASRRPFRAAFVVEGDGQQKGARRLDVEGLEAAFCLDGFLVDEVLAPEDSASASQRPAMAARTARRLAERQLAGSAPTPPPTAAHPAFAAALRAAEAMLARVGLPMWFGRMPIEGSPAAWLSERGLPTVVVGTGVTGACGQEEIFSVPDAVLSVRLLVSLSEM